MSGRWPMHAGGCLPGKPTQTTLSLRRVENNSHIWKDPIHEKSHDSSTEDPGHRDSHKPSHKDVPKEAPVHSLSWADPAHSHHRTHLLENRHFEVKIVAQIYKKNLELPDSFKLKCDYFCLNLLTLQSVDFRHNYLDLDCQYIALMHFSIYILPYVGQTKINEMCQFSLHLYFITLLL